VLLPEPVAEPVGLPRVTPGIKVASSVKLRPLSGSSVIWGFPRRRQLLSQLD
jgi:hypothetical protein